MVQIQVSRQMRSGSITAIGTRRISGGIGRNEELAKPIAPRMYGAEGRPAKRSTGPIQRSSMVRARTREHRPPHPDPPPPIGIGWRGGKCLGRAWRLHLLVDFGVRRGGAALQEVEIAALVRLQDVLRVQLAVAARVVRRRCRPRRTAALELRVV